MKADWVRVQHALKSVTEAVDVIDSEEVPLMEAVGRVSAAEVVAPIDLPVWTNSAMDGFAVRSGDIAGATRESPVVLRVIDDIPAGGFPRAVLLPGTAARVMTGGAVPEGADSVVRVEHTDSGTGRAGAGAQVSVFTDQDAGRNVRRRGEEVTRGSIALERGTVLRPGAIGVAASLGRSTLAVIRRPVVALLGSGDELVDLDRFDEVAAGRKIVSSNSYVLAALLKEAGCEVRDLGIARDTPESLTTALLRARGCDALITSAGISVGEHDHIRPVLMSLGAEVLFWRVRMRPGSPFAFGRIRELGGIPWFGLPGNPVSAAVTFELFARPALRRMAGHTKVFRRPVRARLLDAYTPPPGLTHFVRVRLESGEGDGLVARLTGPQGSGILRSVALADGLMVIPDDEAGVRSGDVYSVLPLDGAIHDSDPGI